MTWLESEKERLRNINGLDPVEELLSQIGVCQHSNAAAVHRMNEAFERCTQLASLCARAADALETLGAYNTATETGRQTLALIAELRKAGK